MTDRLPAAPSTDAPLDDPIDGAADGPAEVSELDALVAGVGAHIKALRIKRGLTLAGLAEDTGMSVSMLSTVERGRTAPSLGTLQRIARGLDVRVGSLFTHPAVDESPVRRRDEQVVGETAGGVVRRLAVFAPDQDVEVYVDEYGAGTSHAIRPSRHPGQEYGVVLQGALEVELGEEVHVVEAGDAVHYEAERAHLIRNAGRGVARAVWVNVRRL